MKGLQLSRRVFLAIITALVVAVLIVAALYILLVKNNKDNKTVVVSQETRESLLVGNCSDDELKESLRVRNNSRGSDSETAALEDLGSCYEFRNDRQNARNVYQELAELQESNGQTDLAESTRQTVENMDFLIEAEKNPKPEVDLDEPMAN